MGGTKGLSKCDHRENSVFSCKLCPNYNDIADVKLEFRSSSSISLEVQIIDRQKKNELLYLSKK